MGYTLERLDPTADLYQKMRTANNDVEVSLEDLDDGLQKSKALAAVAGGDAGKALKNVADLLDSAGESLSDVEDAPASLDEFKKDFSAYDEKRLKSIDAAIGALQAVDSAADILSDLEANVPPARKEDLTKISDDTDEADDDLREAITLMGGKIPADQDDGSDPE